MEVVNGLTQTQRLREYYNVQIEEGLPEQIACDLLADRNSPIAPTLQILLTKLWRKATSVNGCAPQLTAELYRDLRADGLALGDFLDKQLVELAATRPKEVESGLALDILAYHTTPLLTSKQRSQDECLKTYSHLAEVLPPLMLEVQRLFLLSDAIFRLQGESHAPESRHAGAGCAAAQRTLRQDWPAGPADRGKPHRRLG